MGDAPNGARHLDCLFALAAFPHLHSAVVTARNDFASFETINPKHEALMTFHV
jgi:hypothetical protein